MGVTGVKLWHYAVGGLGMVPGTVIYVYFGTAISDVADAAAGNFEGGWLQWTLLGVGTAFAIIAVVVVSCVAKRALGKVLKKEKERKALEKQEAEEKERDLEAAKPIEDQNHPCLLYTSPSPRDKRQSRMPSSA